MGFLDRLLGRGKKVASDVGDTASEVGEKVDDLLDRDEKKESPPTATTPPSAPSPGGEGRPPSSGGGGGGAS
jgi:hypothetical protein